jgi:hypothetical protein
MNTNILGCRKSVDILHLEKTFLALRVISNILEQLTLRKGKFLFISTTPVFDNLVTLCKNATNQFGLTGPWLRGALTNFNVLKSLGEYKKLSKFSVFPDMVFLLDVTRNLQVLNEINAKGIPVLALADSNVSVNKITYGLPSNDDSFLLVYFFLMYFIFCLKHFVRLSTRVHTKKKVKKKAFVKYNILKLKKWHLKTYLRWSALYGNRSRRRFVVKYRWFDKFRTAKKNARFAKLFKKFEYALAAPVDAARAISRILKKQVPTLFYVLPKHLLLQNKVLFNYLQTHTHDALLTPEQHFNLEVTKFFNQSARSLFNTPSLFYFFKNIIQFYANLSNTSTKPHDFVFSLVTKTLLSVLFKHLQLDEFASNSKEKLEFAKIIFKLVPFRNNMPVFRALQYWCLIRGFKRNPIPLDAFGSYRNIPDVSSFLNTKNKASFSITVSDAAVSDVDAVSMTTRKSSAVVLNPAKVSSSSTESIVSQKLYKRLDSFLMRQTKAKVLRSKKLVRKEFNGTRDTNKRLNTDFRSEYGSSFGKDLNTQTAGYSKTLKPQNNNVRAFPQKSFSNTGNKPVKDYSQKPFNTSGKRVDTNYSQKPYNNIGNKPVKDYSQKSFNTLGKSADTNYNQKPYNNTGNKPVKDYSQKPFNTSGKRVDTKYNQKPYNNNTGNKSFKDYSQKPYNTSGKRAGINYNQKPYNNTGNKPVKDYSQKPFNTSGKRHSINYNQKPYTNTGKKPFRDYSQKPYNTSGKRAGINYNQKPYTNTGKKRFKTFGKFVKHPFILGTKSFKEYLQGPLTSSKKKVVRMSLIKKPKKLLVKKVFNPAKSILKIFGKNPVNTSAKKLLTTLSQKKTRKFSKNLIQRGSKFNKRGKLMPQFNRSKFKGKQRPFRVRWQPSFGNYYYFIHARKRQELLLGVKRFRTFYTRIRKIILNQVASRNFQLFSVKAKLPLYLLARVLRKLAKRKKRAVRRIFVHVKLPVRRAVNRVLRSIVVPRVFSASKVYLRANCLTRSSAVLKLQKNVISGPDALQVSAPTVLNVHLITAAKTFLVQSKFPVRMFASTKYRLLKKAVRRLHIFSRPKALRQFFKGVCGVRSAVIRNIPFVLSRTTFNTRVTFAVFLFGLVKYLGTLADKTMYTFVYIFTKMLSTFSVRDFSIFLFILRKQLALFAFKRAFGWLPAFNIKTKQKFSRNVKKFLVKFSQYFNTKPAVDFTRSMAFIRDLGSGLPVIYGVPIDILRAKTISRLRLRPKYMHLNAYTRFWGILNTNMGTTRILAYKVKISSMRVLALFGGLLRSSAFFNSRFGDLFFKKKLTLFFVPQLDMFFMPIKKVSPSITRGVLNYYQFKSTRFHPFIYKHDTRRYDRNMFHHRSFSPLTYNAFKFSQYNKHTLYLRRRLRKLFRVLKRRYKLRFKSIFKLRPMFIARIKPQSGRFVDFRASHRRWLRRTRYNILNQLCSRPGFRLRSFITGRRPKAIPAVKWLRCFGLRRLFFSSLRGRIYTSHRFSRLRARFVLLLKYFLKVKTSNFSVRFFARLSKVAKSFLRERRLRMQKRLLNNKRYNKRNNRHVAQNFKNNKKKY